MAEGKDLKDQLAAIEGDLNALEVELQIEGQKIPNDTHPDVPIGGEEMAVLRREVGAKRDFSFEAASHVDVGERLGMFDFAPGGEGVRFAVRVPHRRRRHARAGAHQLGHAEGGEQGFQAHGGARSGRQAPWRSAGSSPGQRTPRCTTSSPSELCLAGTAEILLGGVYMDEVVDEKQLPIKMAAFSHCFRTEAGAAGASTRGMYRLHQFSKVEMFVVSTPEQSDELPDELIGIEEEMYRELGFHFKVLDMSSEDLGAPAYRKFDIEAWMPALERYGEISSASNCTDYQARRLNIKYRPDAVDGKKQPLAHCHTLNATACAVPRMIITILENFQNEDGSVDVPEPLRPFLGGKENSRRKTSRRDRDDGKGGEDGRIRSAVGR